MAPDGYQYRTLPRVLIPVGVQALLALMFAASPRCCCRARTANRRGAPDVRAPAAAAEAVLLLA